MTGRTIWGLGAGIESVPMIRRAKELGYRCLICDKNPEAPGAVLADRFFPISIYDGVGQAEAARDCGEKIDGAICLGVDAPVACAAVTDALGLPGHSPELARLSEDKLKQKLNLQAWGLFVPPVREVFHINDAHLWMQELGHILEWAQLFDVRCCFSPRIVVKPRNSRGSRGVTILDVRTAMVWLERAVLEAQQFGPPIIEAFLEGPQISTESIVAFGHLYQTTIVDRNYNEPKNGKMIENGGQWPSQFENRRGEIEDLLRRAIKWMRVVNGTVKGDLVMTPQGPAIIELALRLSGGFMASIQTPMVHGIDLVGIALRLACGEVVRRSEMEPKFNRALAIRYQMNDAVHHAERGPFAIGTGATREEAVLDAERRVAECRFYQS